MRVVPGASARPFARALATSSTDTAFAARTITLTEPTGAGVIDLSQNTPTRVRLIPFGAGSDNTTFQLRLIGWSRSSPDGSWIPSILWQGVCTLSTAVGVASGIVIASERLADTIVTDTNMGSAGVDCVVLSPANDTPAHVVIDTKGSTKVEVLIDVGTATSGNALIAGV